jgi:hypothetical protein
MTKELEDKGKAALAASARAFTKAQKQGNVWVGQDGLFETCEMYEMYVPPPPKNPDQLRLA